jgi:hypothetical protein
MFVKIADTIVDDNCIQAGVNFIDINGMCPPSLCENVTIILAGCTRD